MWYGKPFKAAYPKVITIGKMAAQVCTPRHRAMMHSQEGGIIRYARWASETGTGIYAGSRSAKFFGGGSIKSLTNKAVPLLIGVLLAPAFLAPVQAQRTLTMGKLAMLSLSHI